MGWPVRRIAAACIVLTVCLLAVRCAQPQPPTQAFATLPPTADIDATVQAAIAKALPSPTLTPTPNIAATAAPIPTSLPSPAAMPTATAMPTPTATRTAIPTATPVPTPTNTPTAKPTPAPQPPTTPTTSFPGWQFNDGVWRAAGAKPPSCTNPIVLPLPVSLANVTSILYPGQLRGNNYKPHGGFRFDRPGQTTAVETRAPMAATIYRGSRYLENGEIQYMFDFINDCGIMFRLDHLRELAPRFQALAVALPAAAENDSRTTPIPGTLSVTAGELIGTHIGLRDSGLNVFVDYGVYDLRQRNASSQNPAWLAAHPGEIAPYAVCWFDWLSASDAAAVRALPSSDGVMGKTSDYCPTAKPTPAPTNTPTAKPTNTSEDAAGLKNPWDFAVKLGVPATRVLASDDFDGNGLIELVVAGPAPTKTKKSRFVVLSQNANGFADTSSTYLPTTLEAYDPIVAYADFDGDGKRDLLVFDRGYHNDSQCHQSVCGYVGAPPSFFKWSTNKFVDASTSLRTTYAAANKAHSWFPNTTSNVHVKSIAIGDIDNDGDQDVWVESSGGFNITGHFLVNDGKGIFTADVSEARRAPGYYTGAGEGEGYYRYHGAALADVDGDGFVDLVLGQLKRVNNGQDKATSVVAYNDKTGHFASAVTKLPHPAFQSGYSVVTSLVVADFDGDGKRDIALMHTRTTDGSPGWTGGGRYLQLLSGLGNRQFADTTQVKIPDQSAMLPTQVTLFGAPMTNYNDADRLLALDLSGDSKLDLFFGRSSAPIGLHAPLWLESTLAGFTFQSPAAMLGHYSAWFGSHADALDLNGDNKPDVVSFSREAGQDGTYNTEDDNSTMHVSLWRSEWFLGN